jgi:uncharacterized protein (UPF0332 family)
LTPEAAGFLDKARQLLADAEAMLTITLTEAAGRTAYLAGFHAAQAFIFEKRGRTFKTHSGVQAEFARLVKDDPRCDIALRRFLGRTYNLKAIADYETGPRSRITSAQAQEAVEMAARFVAAVTALIEP